MIDPEPIQLNQKEEIQDASFTIKDNNGVGKDKHRRILYAY